MFKNEKPIINYPCKWEYKVIGTSVEHMKSSISDIFLNKDYQISLSKSSSQNKYSSLKIETIVKNEIERNELFLKLQNSKTIKIVL